jgi:LPPG:FO 2-phospho-L-lactate transferase
MSHITVLTAGQGGIRFLTGLTEVRPEEDVHVVANVGSDCEIWGLYCCPDIDLVLHASSGQVDPFRPGETNGTRASYECFETIRKLGVPTWLRICDRDLATHLVRSEMLRAGTPLEEATGRLAERFGLGVKLMPATNDRLRTRLETAEGALPALQYASRREQGLEVTAVAYEGADNSRAASGVVDSILGATRVILAPSDPVLGLGPMLAVPELRSALARTRAGVVAISPFVGSQPARGSRHRSSPAGSAEPPPSVRLAERLRGLVDSFVLHTTDVEAVEAVRSLGLDAWVDHILMNTRDEGRRLAGRVAFEGREIARKR